MALLRDHPNVSNQFRRLVVHWTWKPRSKDDIDDADHDFFLESLEGFCAVQYTSWDSHLLYSKLDSEVPERVKQEESLMHVLISALPSLRSLTIFTTSRYEEVAPEQFYTGLVPLIPPIAMLKPIILLSLRKLLLGSPDITNTHPRAYMPYFHLPKLQTIILFGILHDFFEHDGSVYLPEE
jgi:hypothetical protein